MPGQTPEPLAPVPLSQRNSLLRAAEAAEQEPARLSPQTQPPNQLLDAAGLLPDRLPRAMQEGAALPVDRAQRILQLQQETGFPARLIEQNFDVVDRQARAGRLDLDDLRKRAPALANWLAQGPAHAASMTPDDLVRAQALEGHLRWAAPWLRGIDQLQGLAYATTEALGEVTGFDPAIEFGREGRERNRFEALAYGKGADLATAFDSAQDFAHYTYQLVGEQVPLMAPAMASGFAGGVAGFAVGGPAGALIGSMIGAFVPSWVLGVGEVQSTIKDLDPDAVAPTYALVGGTAVGALDTVLPGKIGGRLVRTFGRDTAEKAARRLLLQAVKPKFLVRTARGAVEGMATEALTEGIQEALGQVTAHYGADRRWEWGEVAQQSLEAAFAGAILGGLFGGGSSAYEFRSLQKQHVQAKQQEAFFKALGGVAQDAEFLQQLPEPSRQWLAEATKDGPIEQVFVPIAPFEAHYQKLGESPDLVAQAITGRPDALDEAKATGTGLLPINTADYASKVAATEQHTAFFQRELKLRPDMANVREVEEAMTRAQTLLAEARSQAREKARSDADTIRAGLVAMWVERGTARYQAEKWAALYTPRYMERARRKGVDPLQLFERDPRVAFYSLASGAPLIPTAPVSQGQAAAEAPGQATVPPVPGAPLSPQDLLAAVPDTALSPEREQALDAAFHALLATPAQAGEAITLAEHGFTPEEVQALDAAGLAAEGRMTPGQFADYLDTRAVRAQAARRAAAWPELGASLPPAEGESTADGARRRGLQLAALASILHREAQGTDPTVSLAAIREELERRVSYDEEQQRAIIDSGRGQGLLRAIADLGGLWFNARTGGDRGEVLHYAREARDRKDVSQRGGRSAEVYDQKEWDVVRSGQAMRGVVPTWNGVPGVFRADGHDADTMAEALREHDWQFGHIEGPNDLFDAIDLAIRASTATQFVVPGTTDLARLGIQPGTRWWEDRWGVDPAQVALEDAFDRDAVVEGVEGVEGLDEPTFDPAEFEQRAKAGRLPHGAQGFDTGSDDHEVRLPGGGLIHLMTPDAMEGPPPGYLYVASVVLPPEQRGRGLGRKLYEAAVGYALSKGYQGLSSDPAFRNAASDAMWRALERDGVVQHGTGVGGRYDTVTYTGGEFFQRDTTTRARVPRVLQRGPARPASATPIPQTVKEAANLQRIEATVAASGQTYYRVPLKQLIQDAVRQAIVEAGLKAPLDPRNPAVREYLIEALTREAEAALRDHPGALDWYRKNVAQAREVVGLLSPELLTDENAWFVFTYALAILSNGIVVEENLPVAYRGYEHFAQTQMMPTDLAIGANKATMDAQLVRFNKEVDKRGGVAGGGLEAYRAFLLTLTTPRALRKQKYSAKAPADRVVYGALSMGPKVGNGFWLNLNGIFSQLTADRWFVRTWARLTGALFELRPDLVKKNAKRLEVALKALTPEERKAIRPLLVPKTSKQKPIVLARDATYSKRALVDLANRVRIRSGDKADRAVLSSTPALDEVRRASLRMLDVALVEKESPQGVAERPMMEDVVLAALANLAALGYPLQVADFQALVWYPEKDLYRKASKGQDAGDLKDDPPDYAQAAVKFARTRGIPEDQIQAAVDRGTRAAAAGRAAGVRRGEPGGVAETAGRPGEPAVSLPVQAADVVDAKAEAARQADRRERVVASTAIPPTTGEFFQRDQVDLASTTLAAFYSRLTLPVRAAKADAAKGADWKAIIRTAKTGINLDEYAAVGVEALDDTTTYTRDEVLAFLRAHQVQLEVVELGGAEATVDPQLLLRETERVFNRMVTEAIERAKAFDRGSPFQYDPGAIDVRENDDGTFDPWFLDVNAYYHLAAMADERFATKEAARRAGEVWIEEANDERRREWETDIRNSVSYHEAELEARQNVGERLGDRQARFTEYVQPGAVASSYREWFLTAPHAGNEARALLAQRKVVDDAIAAVEARVAAETDEFAAEESGLDLLRRMRAADDYRVSGGFRFLALSPEENAVLDASTPLLWKEVVKAGFEAKNWNWRDGHSSYDDIVNPIVRIRWNVRQVGPETVMFLEEVQPPTTDSGNFAKMPPVFQAHWAALAMRFALQHAAVHGYDRVAWTNGEMQVERYPGIRTVAERINFWPEEKRLVALSPTGRVLLDRKGVEERDLAHYLGGEDAARLLAAKPQTSYVGAEKGWTSVATYAQVLSLEGGRKQFGGEGLAALYDKGLVNTANSLPALRRAGVSVKPMVLPDMVERQQPVSDEEAARSYPYSPGVEIVTEPATVPGYPITPKLREQLLTRGQEFFQQSGDPRAPYQATLFGEPLKPVDPLAPVLPTRTALVTQTARRLGADRVRTPKELAAAMAHLARGAQERLDGLVTDADGVPLAIVGGFKGGVDSATIAPEVLLAEALLVPGAARVWIVHNHPSGDSTLSQADKDVLKGLRTRTAGTGVQVMGMMAIGAGVHQRQWSWVARPDETERSGPATPYPDALTTVPVVEREFVATDRMSDRKLNTRAVVAATVPQLAQGQFGVVFIDARMRPVGFAPLDPATATALREEGRAEALFQTWATSGASRAYIYTPTTNQHDDAAINVATALTQVGVEVVDIVDPEGTLSMSRSAFLGGFTQPQDAGPGGGLPPGTRGSFNRYTGWIRLIEGATDLSTFLHESGHAFLHELMVDALDVSATDPAALTDLQQGLIRDAHTVLRWFNFEGTLADFLNLTTDQQRAMHEQWARSFEVYLMTGVAPSEELRPIFATFRAWMATVYRLYLKLSGRPLDQAAAEAAVSRRYQQPTTLPADVRAVMDRLLASDEAIAAVREEREVVPLFTDQATAGVPDLVWAAYRKTVEEAHIRQRELLDARLLSDWRREQQVEWQRQRERMRSQVVTEANTNPVFVALAVMRTGKLPDGSIPSFGDGRPMKLSRAHVVRAKGEAFLKRLPRPYLYTRTGGFDPDVLAELMGFTSGDALLDALVDARAPAATIEAETDRRMREAHGDLLLDGLALHDLAEQALHEHRSEVIAAELKALTQGMAAAAIPSGATLRAAAERAVAQLTVRELQPGMFLQAATRAGQRAFDAFARNDRAAAIRAKTDELTQLAMYRAVAAAKERAKKSATLLGGYQTSPGRRKTLLKAGADYLDQVDALLERYEFTKTTQRAQARRDSLRKWIEIQKANGLPVQIADWLIDDARLINYTRLTVEELDGLRDAVEHIGHLARLKRRLLHAQDQRDLAEIRAEIAGSIEAKNPKQPLPREPHLGWAKASGAVAGVGYSHRKIASLIRQLDGFEDGGLLWQHVMRRLNDAATKEASMNGAALAAITGLFERHYTSTERAAFTRKRRTVDLDVVGQPPASYSKQALLLMALNQGNETNRQRLHDGYGWTQEQVQRALDAHLTRRDWEFVQGVWDHIESYWPQILEKQARVTGTRPEKVLPTPVFTRFGEFRGGYFPIVWETRLSPKAQSFEEGTLADMAKAAAYVHNTTRRGHLERRVDGPVKRPVRLDFNVITQHLGQVIHDLTHHEVLIDVGRILDTDHEVGQAILDTLGVGGYEQFRTALRDIALGDPAARHEVEGFLGWIKNGQTIVGLGWNMMTAALQWVGYTQTIQRVGAIWALKGLGSFWRGALTMQGQVKAIHAESEMMRLRHATQSQELYDLALQAGIAGGPLAGWIDAGLRGVSGGVVTKRAIAESHMYLIRRMQQMVDIPTYLAAKAKAAADPANRRADGTLDDAKVMAIAEQTVIDTQGGGQVKDLAAVQRGPTVWKIWINFYSFFNTTYQLLAESVHKNGGKLRVNPANPYAVGRLAADVLLLVALPTVLTHVTRSLLKGTADDEWEEATEDPWGLLLTLTGESVSYAAGTMVIVRDIAQAVERLGRYEGPAGVRGIGTIARAFVQAGQVGKGFIEEGPTGAWEQLDADGLKTWNQAAGLLFHYPAGAVEKVVLGIEALVAGETDNPLAPLFGLPPE